jgi:hypothetical protein
MKTKQPEKIRPKQEQRRPDTTLILIRVVVNDRNQC